MMKRMIFTAMLLHCVCAGIGADSLTGKVTDEAHRGVAYANVVLLALPDSVFVAGTVSDADGCFMLEASALGEGLLRFSCLGYHSCTVPASGFTGAFGCRAWRWWRNVPFISRKTVRC